MTRRSLNSPPLSVTAIYKRCTSKGECRIWSGGTSSSGYPYVYWDEAYREGKSCNGLMTGRRLVWTLKQGAEPAGVIKMTCRNKLCLWHGHMVDVSRAKAGAMDAEAGAFDTLRHRVARIANSRGAAKIDMEIAADIRRRVLELGEARRSVARDLSLSPNTVSEIVRGKYWKPAQAPNCSVFHMQVAA